MGIYRMKYKTITEDNRKEPKFETELFEKFMTKFLDSLNEVYSQFDERAAQVSFSLSVATSVLVTIIDHECDDSNRIQALDYVYVDAKSAILKHGGN